MEIKEDCFAYDSKYKQCNALNDLYCKKENCKFYKSKDNITQAYIESCIRNYTATIRNK